MKNSKSAILMLTALAALSACQSATPKTSDAIFFSADRSSNGLLDHAEYERFVQLKAEDGDNAAYKTLKLGASDAKLQKQFQIMDANHDGQLSRHEANIE